jgi:hypothetical protein
LLLYDSFSVRSLELDVLLFPPRQERFREGILSEFYAALNADDLFDDCSLRQRLGAIYEGERLTFDIEASRISLHIRSFQSIQEVRELLSVLLRTTKNTLSAAGMDFLYVASNVRLWGLVPDGQNRDVAEIIHKSLPATLQQAQRQHLEGLDGTGLNMSGRTASYGYTVVAAPYLSEPANLYLEASLDFIPDPADVAADDIAAAAQTVQTTYDFLTTETIRFAE